MILQIIVHVKHNYLRVANQKLHIRFDHHSKNLGKLLIKYNKNPLFLLNYIAQI